MPICQRGKVAGAPSDRAERIGGAATLFCHLINERLFIVMPPLAWLVGHSLSGGLEHHGKIHLLSNVDSLVKWRSSSYLEQAAGTEVITILPYEVLLLTGTKTCNNSFPFTR